MWIQVRSMDGSKCVRVDGLSKLTKIEELREKLVEPFNANPDCQRLFYRGKEMVNGHSLFEYSVGLNETVQIIIRRPTAVNETIITNKCVDTAGNPTDQSEEANNSDNGTEINDLTRENSTNNDVNFGNHSNDDATPVISNDQSSLNSNSDCSSKNSHSGNSDIPASHTESKSGNFANDSNQSHNLPIMGKKSAVKGQKSLMLLASFAYEDRENRNESTCYHVNQPVKVDDNDNVTLSKNDDVSNSTSVISNSDACDAQRNCNDVDPHFARINNAVQETSEPIFKIGDVIDAIDPLIGAWFEAYIIGFERKNESSEKIHREMKRENDCQMNQDGVSCEDDDVNSIENKMEVDDMDDDTVDEKHVTDMENDDGYSYSVKYIGYDDLAVSLSSSQIRPRSHMKISSSDVLTGDRVMINYNIDDPKKRGFWYDAIITQNRLNMDGSKRLVATIFAGGCLVPLNNCDVRFIDEIFKIEVKKRCRSDSAAITSTNSTDVALNVECVSVAKSSCTTVENVPGNLVVDESTFSQQHKETREQSDKSDGEFKCDKCHDDSKKKCHHCACCVCGEKRNPEKQILCDECDAAYHIWCLKPALADIPDVDEWYCPECKNDSSEVVQAGEKLKESKKLAKLASMSAKNGGRDWGKGMACVGRTKQCALVPPNHFGPIPGIEVGTMWKFRVQVSEAGVHRPHVAGIHGREDEGAYSIVLSGGYEDDVDNGDEFQYTGSGGRDLSGNKRTAGQSCDQQLTLKNKALAKNCKVRINPKEGAEASDWRTGKPVRVVRNYKGGAHSSYAPEEGNRYDGIYKVVKYWPEKGQSGFNVWKYLLRRDDPEPAPWTDEGQRRMEELGLKMQFPEGYVEEVKEEIENDQPADKGKGKGKKSKRISSDDSTEPVAKKYCYSLECDVAQLISNDERNKRLWDEALTYTHQGAQAFLGKVDDLFRCICCQDVVYKPITTPCLHNICKCCLLRSFKAEVYSCPACRGPLSQESRGDVNVTLSTALNKLFPGYENGR